MKNTNVEFLAKVCDIADEKRIKKEGLATRLPPEGYKLLLLKPLDFKNLSYWRWVINNFRGTFKKHCDKPNAKIWNGLAMDDISVPSNFPVKVDDIIKLKGTIEIIDVGVSA